MDTLLSMLIGFAINSAMIIIAAATFFADKINVTELGQAHATLEPLLGNAASVVFALALLFSGISSSITAGMAGGSIYTGFFKESYDIHDSHTRHGIEFTIIPALLIIFFIKDPFMGLVYSQMLLSILLPITVFVQIYLTSSKRVMGKYVNSKISNIFLWLIGIVVAVLNIMLFIEML